MKKAFEIFYEKNKKQSEKVFKETIKKVLRSYQLQTNLGISDLNAFENSLLNPTLKKTKKIKLNELEIKNAKIKQNSPKLNKLFLYEEKLDAWISQRVSLRKMKKLLLAEHRYTASHETIRKYVKMKFDQQKLNKI